MLPPRKRSRKPVDADLPEHVLEVLQKLRRLHPRGPMVNTDVDHLAEATDSLAADVRAALHELVQQSAGESWRLELIADDQVEFDE